jgi:hypothetical protein
LKVRQNLDVMHIDKNICESLMATILNIPRKTKDTIKALLDLKDLVIKKELQFREIADSCQMPHGRYTLSKEQKKGFYDFLREVKFLDGFNFTSASETLSKDSAIDQMVWFVLNNCSQVKIYVDYVLITILCSVVFYFCKKLQNVQS